MREFNTSGPNDPTYHYTILRKDFIEKGKQLIYRKKYFTVWAPRQTGKSTWFLQLAEEMTKEGYQVAHINFENYRKTSIPYFLKNLAGELNYFWGTNFPADDLSDIFYKIETTRDQKWILIIDEVEGINKEYFGDFLHSIRKAYHSRQRHSLHSVILVGKTNILKDATFFNIAENLEISSFTNAETKELLEQHEIETGQLFSQKVKLRISEITANQPVLVNSFANQLVTRYSDKNITYKDYLKVEHYLGISQK